MGMTSGRRRGAVAVAAVLTVVVVAAIAYRVLAPAEVDTPARTAYPPAASPPVGVIGRLPVAPLIVDGRLRVYAATRQVYADQPVDRKHRVTPFWSYRRWPAQLNGVLAVDTTVLSRWSDGKLVALDARTGKVAWRADGPRPGAGFVARRTGAAVVWDPQGISVASGPDGRAVLVVSGQGRLRGYAMADGRELWRVDGDGACRTDLGTTAADRVVSVDAGAGPAVVEFRDAVTGAVRTRWRPPDAGPELTVTPLGCLTPRSRCRGLRTAGPGDPAGRGWLVGAGEPIAAPALDAPEVTLAGELAVGVTGGVLGGREARTGIQRWRRGDLGPVRVLATEPGRVYVLTDARELITLDPVTGAQRSRFVLAVGRDGIGWKPGLAYASGGYVAVERLREQAGPGDDDQGWFLTAEPVTLALT
ncbi:PQQ-binding-like beta-propeller repeat protein [Micromonospora sp. R77]|uniref:outer membrane protein assembly factor BamB family protein n=1 Tax=Micromonospora sp. R77 TaxID=2925836 RepID=UPI001F617BEC|nr:PQQ-binding-like beta-propeller repeat protein [Micromonospora sp. R77]MCI4063078.1 PQQ-binding-like beta-propeller repeat protein [Micromonospora sp. R77]